MSELIYCSGTETIRQIPDNYMIARKDGNLWRCDPDLACNQELATEVYLALFEYSTKYGSGGNVIKQVQANRNKLKSVAVSERSIEVFFARGCDCPTITDTLSRTLDEIVEKPRLQCPLCKEFYAMVSTILHV